MGLQPEEVRDYLIAICDFMKPVLVEKYVDVERHPQIITWYAFAVKPIVNWSTQFNYQES